MIDMGLRPDAVASARAVTAGYKVDISRGERTGRVGIDLLSWTVGGLAGWRVWGLRSDQGGLLFGLAGHGRLVAQP
jgi:hypothetical protein